METEKINNRREITNLENEINQKDKIIENMMNETQSNINQSNKVSEMHLVLNVKRQYKELKKAYEKNQQELLQTKKNTKYTKINELTTENKIFNEQIDKLKNLYNHSKEQKQSLKKNFTDFDFMRQALSQKDYIILNFQENCQKMESEIQILNSEKEKLKNQSIKKEEMINSIKNKLEKISKENENLVLKHNNITKSEIYLTSKNKYEAKIQKLKKDIAYYRDLNSKNEKILREAEKINQVQKNVVVATNKISRKIYSSNPQPSFAFEMESGPKSEANQKILLLQSILSEEKSEKEKLLQQVEELTQQLNTSKTIEPKIILANSYSANNIKSSIKVIDYDYLTESRLNEFIYILLKNLEANKIDMSILESRVLNSDTLELLKDKTQYKLFITQLGNNFCEILKTKQQKDQEDIYSFINTFLYNNYVAQEKKNSEEFKSKFLGLFSKISFYSLEQRQELNKIIAIKLNKNKKKLIELLNYFDENEKGVICFNSIKKIFEQLGVKFKNDVKEYIIYVMKCFIDDGNFLKDLKYENLLKILEETQVDPNENIDDIDAEEENKENKEGEDDAIEITNEEYLSKVKNIISRICKTILTQKKNIDDYFLKIVSKSITEYKAIRLIKLVDVLKEEFNIDLSNIEIFCLFTKVKPVNLGKSSKDPDDIEEIIDYSKLKEEIENYMRHPVQEKEKEEQKNSEIVREKSEKKNYKKENKNNNFEEKEKEREKLDYSNMLEHATKNPKSKSKTKSKDSFCSSEKKFDLKKILVNFMEKHKFSFERFIFPIHCMMKLTSNNKKFNRYIDVEFFKHFLYQNGILVQSANLMEYIGGNNLLYNNEKINVDYLKYVLNNKSEDENEKISKNDFMLYRPIKESLKISNIPGIEKEKKICKDKDNDNDVSFGD